MLLLLLLLPILPPDEDTSNSVQRIDDCVGSSDMTETLAVEWAPYNVCVNAIAPGVFPTELNRALLDGTPRGKEFLVRTPMRRFGNLEELAGAAVFLSSDAASFVTGHVLAVDGGFLASGVNQ